MLLHRGPTEENHSLIVIDASFITVRTHACREPLDGSVVKLPALRTVQLSNSYKANHMQRVPTPGCLQLLRSWSLRVRESRGPKVRAKDNGIVHQLRFPYALCAPGLWRSSGSTIGI